MSKLTSGRPSRKEQAIASIQEQKEALVRLNINVPKSFYKQVKQLALDRELSVTDMVKAAVSEYMSK